MSGRRTSLSPIGFLQITGLGLERPRGSEAPPPAYALLPSVVVMRSTWLAAGMCVLAMAGTAGSVERLTLADVPSPTVVGPTPQKSPGVAPLLPPEGLPTAPPPDAIKPVEPRAVQPAPDPASASGRVPAVRMLRSVSGGA